MESDDITSFSGNYRFLSNFYPVIVTADDGIEYPSSEHAYVAYKTHRVSERLFIAMFGSAAEVKKYGRKMELRPDWENVKISVMRDIVLRKFKQNPDLAERLLATGYRMLIEGNNWGDTFWGICGHVGENHLGKILMEVRTYLREFKNG